MIEWLEQHREILSWLAGGAATAAGGGWVVVRYLLDRRDARSALGSPERWQPSHAAASSEAPGPGSGVAVSTGTGVAAAGNVRVEGNVTIQHNRVPKGALVLAAIGLLLLGYMVVNSGSRVTVNNGSAVGGNVTNSTITVTPSK